MSEGAEERLTALVAEWREKLGLLHWNVRVVIVPQEGRTDRYADIQIQQYTHQAMVRVNADVPESEWPHTVVHELLHLVIYPVSDLLRHYLARVHPAEKGALEALHKEAEEPVLERLAEIIIGEPHHWSRGMTHMWKMSE